MGIGNEIRVKRNEKGCTQDELANLVGISRNYISDLENDRYVPSVKTLSKIARELGMNLNFLLETSEIQDIAAEGIANSDESGYRKSNTAIDAAERKERGVKANVTKKL